MQGLAKQRVGESSRQKEQHVGGTWDWREPAAFWELEEDLNAWNILGRVRTGKSWQEPNEAESYWLCYSLRSLS